MLLPTPADIYLLKVNNRNNRTRCEIYSKLPIKTSLLLTLNIFHTFQCYPYPICIRNGNRENCNIKKAYRNTAFYH